MIFKSKLSFGITILFLAFIVMGALSPSVTAGPPSFQANVIEFQNDDEAVFWLMNYAMENGIGIDELFSGQESEDNSSELSGCVNVKLSPSTISTTVPKTSKLFQIIIDVTIGDCGNVLCSTMGFDITWSVAPSGGATIFGPFPSQTIDQVCVGNSISSRGFLILNSGIPKGNYSLKIKVGGFGGASYYYIPVTIS